MEQRPDNELFVLMQGAVDPYAQSRKELIAAFTQNNQVPEELALQYLNRRMILEITQKGVFRTAHNQEEVDAAQRDLRNLLQDLEKGAKTQQLLNYIDGCIRDAGNSVTRWETPVHPENPHRVHRQDLIQVIGLELTDFRVERDALLYYRQFFAGAEQEGADN